MKTVKISREPFSCFRRGLKICGSVFLCSEAPQKLPVAVLCHEFMADEHFCYEYAKTLAECGYAAFTFDFCGGSLSGKSEGDTRDMSALTEAEDIKAVIEFAHRQPFADEAGVLLLGCSQGGFAAALAAAQLKDEVRGLIMLYPALSIPDDARSGKMLGASFDPENIPDTINCGPMLLGRRYVEDVINMEVYAEITKYTGPVLILHGDKDAVVDTDYSKRAARLYRAQGADARLKIIEGGKHVFRKKKHIDEVKKYITAFAWNL